MMRQMREATKPIMLLAALAFVALMVFEWGMDASGRSGGGPGEIGSVNGDPVMYEQYMAVYRQLYDQAQRSQEGMISSQQNTEIEDAAFDEVVTQLLILQALEERGITVTDREISEAAQYNPPDYLRPQFTDESGNLDLQSYQSFLASLMPDQLLALEAYYRDVIPRSKLLRQVSSGIYVTDSELWQQYRDQNEQAEIEYVPMDPSARYPDDQFTISASEIEEYWEENQEEFEVPARATVKAVVLDKTPTPADTAAMRQRADSLRQEIVGGADFAEIARLESADEASASEGGDLGVVPVGQTSAPFDSAVAAAPVGEVVGPVQSSFGFHVLEVQERWGADSARVRHVLISIARTDDSEIELLTMADSLEDLSEDMELEAAAETMGLTVRTTDITADFPILPGAGQVSEGSDWALEEAVPGDVSPVFETPTAFYALELVSSREAGVLPLEDAEPAIRSTLLFERKMEAARETAAEVVAAVRGGEALANAAAAHDLELRSAGPFTRSDFVPGIGRQNAAIGAAFGLEPGEVSDVVSTPANVYVIEVLSRTEADSTAWLAQLPEQRARTIQAEQQQRLQEWIEGLRAAADIRDRRDVVLAQPDDPPVQMPGLF